MCCICVMLQLEVKVFASVRPLPLNSENFAFKNFIHIGIYLNCEVSIHRPTIKYLQRTQKLCTLTDSLSLTGHLYQKKTEGFNAQPVY